MYEGKYFKLLEYLKHKQDEIRLTITFSEIEEILNFELPSSAKKYNAWWQMIKHIPRLNLGLLLVGTQAK